MAIVGIISEEKIIEVRTCSYRNPIFLRWRTDLGAEACWLFSGRKIEEETKITDEVITLNSEGDNFRKYDIEYMTSFERTLHKNVRQNITCYSPDLSEANKRLLQTLPKSTAVQMLTNPSTWNVVEPSVGVAPGAKWMDVMIDGTNFKWGKTDNNNSTLQFTIIKQLTITPRR